MVEYIHDHYDPDDINRYHRIELGIEAKQDAIARHNAYTVYKSENDPEMRELARQIFLEKTGIHQDFRW